MANNEPRRHHFLPQFYLAGFTDTGERDGRLHVVSLEDGRRWIDTPESVGHQRDFYRLHGVEGEEAFALERAFAGLEGNAATAIRFISENRRLPDDDDQYSYLINFVALMSARVPQTRANLARPFEEAHKMIWQITLSKRERFEAQVEQARKSGVDVPDVEYEQVRRSLKDDRIIFEATRGAKEKTSGGVTEPAASTACKLRISFPTPESSPTHHARD